MMKEILQKIRKYEIQIRKAVKSPMGGEMRSVFKGSGIEFDDVRPYQYGDDVRNIDWNVTAKGHGAFVKTFKEDKDQSVFILVDVSKSQEIGNKLNTAKEIASVLGLSSVNLGSQVGLYCFSSKTELLLKPKKGKIHGHDMITKLYSLKPKAKDTNIDNAIKAVMGIMKKTSLMIIISDFLDENYEKNIKLMASRHDVVAIQVFDQHEMYLPRLGIVPVQDNESGKYNWVNTSLSGFRKKITKQHKSNLSYLTELSNKNQIDFISIQSEENYVNKLVQLFKRRNTSWKRAS